MQLFTENFRRGISEIIFSILHSEVTLTSRFSELVGITNHASKSETKTEMERADILVLARIGIDAVI